LESYRLLRRLNNEMNKPYTNTQYADLAVYCNRNGLVIEDKGDYLEAVNPHRKNH
jgi:hypothetical protein